MSQTTTTLPLLIVRLGQPLDLFLREVPPGLEAVRSQFGHLVSGPHQVRIVSEGWTLDVPQTRFSSVEFDEGIVNGVEVNPHPENLTLEQAAQLLDRLELEFTGFGFRPDPERKASGADLRSRAAEIARESTYQNEPFRARRANVICSIVLKKSVLKDSYLGTTAQIKTDLFLLTLAVRIQKAGGRF